MEYEWGPWIKNNRAGFPKSREFAQWEYATPVRRETNTTAVLSSCHKFSTGWTTFKGSSWHWTGAVPIIRYRIRKPLVSKWLQSISVDKREVTDA